MNRPLPLAPWLGVSSHSLQQSLIPVLKVRSPTKVHFTGRCLDDLMHDVLEAIFGHGRQVTARRGDFTELIGITLRLDDPRARLSRTETRGRPFSALGEFCWYMSGRDDLASIEYYIPEYRRDAVEGVLTGAYGPRLVGERDDAQLRRVVGLLREHPTSRRAVIRLFDAADLREERRDIPCTCTLQYFVREERLEAITCMRSNDVYWGLPHDVFCFTLLQEYVARNLGVDLGTYTHVVGSLHLYDTHTAGALQFLREGFQSTEHPMPEMPIAEPERSLNTLLAAEAVLRGQPVAWDEVDRLSVEVDSYWADLIRLLRVLRVYKDNHQSLLEKTQSFKQIQNEMSSDVYHPFIAKLAGRLRNA